MTDEDSIHDEEVEETNAEDEDSEEDGELASSDEASYSASGGGGSSKAAAETEALEDFSIASRQKVRDELGSQVAEFLARGGKINEVPANVTADPPKKPTSDYGGRPI